MRMDNDEDATRLPEGMPAATDITSVEQNNAANDDEGR